MIEYCSSISHERLRSSILCMLYSIVLQSVCVKSSMKYSESQHTIANMIEDRRIVKKQ